MKDRRPLHHWTPTFQSLPLSAQTGKDVWLKMECFQPVGSYKIRGIGRLCQHYVDQGFDQFVSASAGNAGIAVAYAGRMLGKTVDVFIPESSNQMFIDAIRAQGANIHIEGRAWDDANKAAIAFCEQVNAAFIPPFDHPLLWAGHATMIKEVAYHGIKPDVVMVSVGGGGLSCGVLEGMEQQGWYDVPFIGVETDGAASFDAALKAGKVVTIDEINTIATSLGAKRICQNLFDWTQDHDISNIVVSDHSAANAARRFADDHRVLIEPASGASLAPLYEQHDKLADFESVLVIVCGGVGISMELLDSYL